MLQLAQCFFRLFCKFLVVIPNYIIEFMSKQVVVLNPEESITRTGFILSWHKS